MFGFLTVRMRRRPYLLSHDQARVSSDAVFHSDELRYASDDESGDQTYLEYDDFDNDDLRMCLPHLRQCFCGIEAVAGEYRHPCVCFCGTTAFLRVPLCRERDLVTNEAAQALVQEFGVTPVRVHVEAVLLNARVPANLARVRPDCVWPLCGLPWLFPRHDVVLIDPSTQHAAFLCECRI